MDDTANLGILLEDSFRGCKIAQVHLFKGRTDAGNLLNTIEHLNLGVREVVNDNHIIACLLQLYCGVTSDESCATGYKNGLFHKC